YPLPHVPSIASKELRGIQSFFFSSRRRHTRSVSAFLLNRSSDLDIFTFYVLHELNPLFTINVTMRDIKSKNVYSRVNSKATTQWRKRSEERRVGKECRSRWSAYH